MRIRRIPGYGISFPKYLYRVKGQKHIDHKANGPVYSGGADPRGMPAFTLRQNALAHAFSDTVPEAAQYRKWRCVCMEECAIIQQSENVVFYLWTIKIEGE